MRTFLPHSAMVAQQWEIAKGHLRAVAALQGSTTCGDGDTSRYCEISRVVEEFIKDFENNGYDEGVF